MARKPQNPELLLTPDGANLSSDNSPDYQKALSSRSADTTNRALEAYKPQPVTLAKPGAHSVIESIQKFVDTGITADNVAALEQLVKLQNTLADREAKQAFEAAFVALQHETPNIVATREIPGNNGTVRSTFAAFEDIMKQVQPLLKKHGFAIRFAQNWIANATPPRIAIVCTLSHIGGHSVQNEFAVPVGKGPPGCSEAQAIGAASSYAKRFALCEALNIVVVGIDDDARAIGGLIDSVKAEELRRRLAAVNGNVEKFLAFAQANSFEEIRESMLDVLENNLAFKEKTATKPATSPLTEKDLPY